jgi:hypothetical protein
MQRLHEIVDPDRVQALNNMIFRMEVIREGAQLRPHPWTMVGGHPAMARELAEGSGELTDKDLLKICQKLCLGREMGESVLVGNADRFYSTLSGWLRAGASVVEVDLGAEEALRGVATMSNRFAGKDELFKVEVGPPGVVNWAWLPAEPGTPRPQPETLHLARAFHFLESEGEPNGLLSWLLQGYQAWGEKAYLARWSEYADDWALHVQRDLGAVPATETDPSAYSPSEQLPWNLRYYSTLVPRVLAGFVTRLRAVVLERPESVSALPAPTLARVLLTALEEYATPNILVARSTRFNWNMMGLSFNIRNSLLLGEFKTGQWLGREATRTLLNHALFSILPDGGYVEYSDEGHQGVWREFGGAALNLLTKHKPAWFDPVLEAELRASLSQNATFWLRHLKPDGFRHRDSYRDAASSYVGKRISAFATSSLDAQTPWITEQPEPARILDTVFGTGAKGTPAHRSDVLPFLGEFLLRGGWGKRDPFFYMHSGHIPNSNPDEDCNAFKLHDFGHHLLTAQPVYVDGRTQNPHAELVDNPGAKTAFLSLNTGRIGNGRWHASHTAIDRQVFHDDARRKWQDLLRL